MNRWGKKALRFYLAGNASGCHMPNMRDSKHRPLQMICSVCCNQQGFHAAGRGLEMYRKPHKCFAVLYCLIYSVSNCSVVFLCVCFVIKKIKLNTKIKENIININLPVHSNFFLFIIVSCFHILPL